MIEFTKINGMKKNHSIGGVVHDMPKDLNDILLSSQDT